MVTKIDSDVVVLALFAAAALNPLYKLEKFRSSKDVISLHIN